MEWKVGGILKISSYCGPDSIWIIFPSELKRFLQKIDGNQNIELMTVDKVLAMLEQFEVEALRDHAELSWELKQVQKDLETAEARLRVACGEDMDVDNKENLENHSDDNTCFYHKQLQNRRRCNVEHLSVNLKLKQDEERYARRVVHKANDLKLQLRFACRVKAEDGEVPSDINVEED